MVVFHNYTLFDAIAILLYRMMFDMISVQKLSLPDQQQGDISKEKCIIAWRIDITRKEEPKKELSSTYRQTELDGEEGGRTTKEEEYTELLSCR